jgi:hypothetical protein
MIPYSSPRIASRHVLVQPLPGVPSRPNNRSNFPGPTSKPSNFCANPTSTHVSFPFSFSPRGRFTAVEQPPHTIEYGLVGCGDHARKLLLATCRRIAGPPVLSVRRPMTDPVRDGHDCGKNYHTLLSTVRSKGDRTFTALNS